MFKTFTFGVILGLVASVGVLYVAPVVDHQRERSIMTVNPNGGSQEQFYANLPGDRIMASVGGGDQTWPEGLSWPDYLDIGNARTEVFKLRNAEDNVVAVASRISVGGAAGYVEWAVHLPARGTLYVLLDGRADGTGARPGYLRAGSREFETRSGVAEERYTAAGSGHNDSEGRLVLTTMLVGADVEDDLVAEVSE